MDKKINLVSLFAGIGGIDLGFEQTKKVQVLWQNEFDLNAIKTLKLNSKALEIDSRDILTVPTKEIIKHDILTGGFPCQPFSLAGKQQSFNDPRGKLIFKIFDIIKFHSPRIVFLENVKNLKSINKGKDLERIISNLEELGYHVKYKVLNTSEYSDLPQNRERLYIIAFKYKKDFLAYEWPKKQNKSKKILDILEPYEDYQIYSEKKYPKIYSFLKEQNENDLDGVYQ